jgi:hypothetical protein
MMVVKKFEPIIVDLPLREIYSRLGYVKGKTQLTDKQQKQLNSCIKKAESLVELKGAAINLDISRIDQQSIVLSNQIILNSKSLAKLLIRSDQALFIGATAGSAIVDAIEENSLNDGDMTQAVVFDAVASEMTDAALDWMVNFYNRILRRENKSLTKSRFSAGYGDFKIEYQKVFFEVLNLKDLGVDITESFLLVPEKSVTAIAGIQQLAD